MARRTDLDKVSLMLSVAGYLAKNRNVPIDELAKHFGVEVEAIDSAVRTIGISGVGQYGPTELFSLNYEMLEEGVVDITDIQALEEIPKLSTAEAAVFVSGLRFLKTLPEFETDTDIDYLLDLLNKGTSQPQENLIEIVPGTPDYDYAKIRDAALRQVRIRCHYVNLRGEHSTRELDPLRLESRDQTWYLQAYCITTEDVRFFKLEQLRLEEVTETPISQAAREAELRNELFEASETDIHVVVELEPEAFVIAAEFGNGEKPVRIADGRIRATINIGFLPYLGKLIAEYGGAAVVISPPEARAVVRDWALRSIGEKGLTEDKIVEE